MKLMRTGKMMMLMRKIRMRIETLNRKQIPLDFLSHFALVPNESFSFTGNFWGIDA